MTFSETVSALYALEKEMFEADARRNAATQPGPDDCPAREAVSKALCTKPRGHASVVLGSKYVWHTHNGYVNWHEGEEEPKP